MKTQVYSLDRFASRTTSSVTFPEKFIFAQPQINPFQKSFRLEHNGHPVKKINDKRFLSFKENLKVFLITSNVTRRIKLCSELNWIMAVNLCLDNPFLLF